jgi:hypothetical protein
MARRRKQKGGFLPLLAGLAAAVLPSIIDPIIRKITGGKVKKGGVVVPLGRGRKRTTKK